MKTLPVGELKAQFSEVLELVKKGESFGIVYGRKKKPIAMIVPYVTDTNKNEREIGFLDGKVDFIFGDHFKMTEEDLLGIQ